MTIAHRASRLIVSVETLRDYRPKPTIVWTLKPKIKINYWSKSYARAIVFNRQIEKSERTDQIHQIRGFRIEHGQVSTNIDYPLSSLMQKLDTFTINQGA